MKFVHYFHRVACGIALVFGVLKIHAGYRRDNQNEKDFGLAMFLLGLILFLLINSAMA